MKKILFFILLVSTQIFSQGLILSSPEEKASYPKLPADKLGFTETLPFSYSLEKYVPPVLKQEGGTCVGFASFYYALSTMYNIEFDMTDLNEKYVHSFDPYFIYSIYFNEKNDCDSGLNFPAGFEKLSNIGAKKLFYPPFTDCGTSWTPTKLKNTLGYTTPYSINNWYYYEIEKMSSSDVIEVVKQNLYNNTPVITGFKFVESMFSYTSENTLGVKSDGLWDPSTYENVSGGHALCVVGYDDYKFGGSFRIVNSWGIDYGDNGYIWVKYDDFTEFVEEIYLLELNENIQELPPTVIETDNYKRYNYKNDTNTYSFYEGQYLLGGLNGYGIWSDKESNTYFIGKYNDADMTGYFLIVDDEGIFSANAVNGLLQDFEKLGFADKDEQLMETQLEAKRYFQKLGEELSIRKANSSRKSTLKTKK